MVSFALYRYLIHNQPLSKLLNNMEPGPDFCVPAPCPTVSSNDNTINMSIQPAKRNSANKSIGADSCLLERGRNYHQEKTHISARLFHSTGIELQTGMVRAWHMVLMHLLGPFLPLKAVEKKPLSPQLQTFCPFSGWLLTHLPS